MVPDPTPRWSAAGGVLLLGLIASVLLTRSPRPAPVPVAMTYIPADRQLPHDIQEHEAIPA